MATNLRERLMPQAMASLVLLFAISTSQQAFSKATWREEPVDTTAVVGEPVTLFCAVDTHGDNIYLPEWYKEKPNSSDERLITDTGTSYDECCIVTGDQTNGEVNLHFESVRLEDEGTWICRSARTVDDQTRYARLTVLDKEYPTPSPTKQKEHVTRSILDNEIKFDILVKQGHLVTMHCKLDNLSHDTIHDWYKEGQDGSLLHIASGSRSYYPEFYNITRPTEGQSELVIKSVNKTDEGIWTCKSSLTPEREVVGMSARLVVLDDDPHCVKVSGVGPNEEVIIGSTVELQCSIGSRAMEYGNLVWTKNGIDTDKKSLNPLKFSKIVKVTDDGARFNCRLNHSTINYQWTCNDDIVFQVQYPLTTQSKSKKLCLRRGDTLNVTCPYVERNPQVDLVTWTVYGNDYVSERLVIENIRHNISHPIAYSCTARNTYFNGQVNEIKIDFDVDIQYEPVVSISHGSEVNVNEGDDLTIDCLVDSDPPSLIKWIRPDGSSVQNSTLVINTIQRTDHGLYNCIAENRMCLELGNIGTGNSLVKVMVMYPPSALNKHENSKIAIDQGEVATLTCEIESYPASSITWFRLKDNDIKPIPDIFRTDANISDSIRVSQLIINNTIPSRDYGVYVCISSNNKGTLAFDITLLGKSKPDPVVDVHLNVSEDSILVTWTPGFDGGYDQRFLVEYCKHPGRNTQRTLETENLTYTIQGLEQNTSYSIQVISLNSLGQSRSELYYVKTMSSVTSTDATIPSDAASPIIICVVIVAIILILVILATAVTLFVRKNFKRRHIYEEVTTGVATVQRHRQNEPSEELSMVEINHYENVETLDTLDRQHQSPNIANNNVEYESPMVVKSTLHPSQDRKQEYAQPHIVHDDPYMKCGQLALEVNNNQTWLKKIIYSGKFYDIYKADAWFIAGKDGVTSVVIKKVKDITDTISDTYLRLEIEMMKPIPRNQNVVELHATCTKHGNPTYLILEFANYGDLKTFLVCNRKQMTSVTDHHKQFLSLAIDVAKGMGHLADQNVLHRFLSAKHILVFKKEGFAAWMCKISNFSYATKVTDPGQYAEMERKPDYRWTALEVLLNDEFSLASDVWSYGILLWEIYTIGTVPYGDISQTELIEELCKGNRLNRPEKCPNKIFTMMSSCWEMVPESRPSIDFVIQDLEVIK
ncbi:fibroblast growth factor receptor 1-A-like [Ptychodera flava]|uniref:fibroblast growth factor receptor 1-A-like n=1 Tax=Ptychodera flava TaxID=63121 RepID=UPI00396AA4D5